LERPKYAQLHCPLLELKGLFPIRKSNEEVAYLFGNGAPSMGTFFFCLPPTLEEKGRESVQGQCLGTAGL
jgi:hypothetical protein